MRRLLQWLRRPQDARRLAQADAEALIRDHGAQAIGRLASASVTWFCRTGQLTPVGRQRTGGGSRSWWRAWRENESASTQRPGCLGVATNDEFASRSGSNRKTASRRSLQHRNVLTIRRRSRWPWATTDSPQSQGPRSRAVSSPRLQAREPTSRSCRSRLCSTVLHPD